MSPSFCDCVKKNLQKGCLLLTSPFQSLLAFLYEATKYVIFFSSKPCIHLLLAFLGRKSRTQMGINLDINFLAYRRDVEVKINKVDVKMPSCIKDRKKGRERKGEREGVEREREREREKEKEREREREREREDYTHSLGSIGNIW